MPPTLSVPCSLDWYAETFPLAVPFVIARGARRVAEVIRVRLRSGPHEGQGECVPYARYGESLASVGAQIDSLRPALARGITRAAVQNLLPAGAARNAIDCALWALEARLQGTRVAALAGLAACDLRPVTTAFTLSVDTPVAMAAVAARVAASFPVLKVKLTGDEADAARLRAVRAAAPQAMLIADANESWPPAAVPSLFALCADLDVALIEQPLPAGADSILATLERPVPVCADESLHDRADLEGLRARYDVINIKLDKTGGLTEALALAQAATQAGFELMVGCMVSTSLSMAPAMLVAMGAMGAMGVMGAKGARFIDLDGPLLLAADRVPGLHYEGATIFPAPAEVWG